MAARKRELTTEIQEILSDAMDRVRTLIRQTLQADLAGLMGGGGGGESAGPGRRKAAGRRGPGRPPKAAAGRRKAGRAAAARPEGKGKPGRKSSATPDRVDKLSDFVASRGEVMPKDARRVMKLPNAQFLAVVRKAEGEGRIKVTGKGRGTRYVKG